MRASAVAAVVFANVHDELLNKLTAKRSMASVPFGARYRLIDFALSNLVAAGISTIGVVTKENYSSLMNHIGSGVHWDLDRKIGGVQILPPYNSIHARRFLGDVEALMGAMDFINQSNADYIVISDANIVANIDLSAALESHIKNEADITVVCHHGKPPHDHAETMILSMDASSRVSGVVFADNIENEVNYSLGITIISRELLSKLVRNAYKSNNDSLNHDIIAKQVAKLSIYAHMHKGYAVVMDSERSYFEANMSLLEADVRKELFNSNHPILTKTRDDMPTRYGTKAVVKNSIIADGCVIEGTVKNSILFRGVRVDKDAVVENCILMQEAHIESGAKLKYVISDKSCVIGAEMVLMGTDTDSFLMKEN